MKALVYVYRLLNDPYSVRTSYTLPIEATLCSFQEYKEHFLQERYAFSSEPVALSEGTYLYNPMTKEYEILSDEDLECVYKERRKEYERFRNLSPREKKNAIIAALGELGYHINIHMRGYNDWVLTCATFQISCVLELEYGQLADVLKIGNRRGYCTLASVVSHVKQELDVKRQNEIYHEFRRQTLLTNTPWRIFSKWINIVGRESQSYLHFEETITNQIIKHGSFSWTFLKDQTEDLDAFIRSWIHPDEQDSYKQYYRKERLPELFK